MGHENDGNNMTGVGDHESRTASATATKSKKRPIRNGAGPVLSMVTTGTRNGNFLQVVEREDERGKEQAPASAIMRMNHHGERQRRFVRNEHFGEKRLWSE
jgi:hypothetical protein